MVAGYIVISIFLVVLLVALFLCYWNDKKGRDEDNANDQKHAATISEQGLNSRESTNHSNQQKTAEGRFSNLGDSIDSSSGDILEKKNDGTQKSYIVSDRDRMEKDVYDNMHRLTSNMSHFRDLNHLYLAPQSQTFVTLSQVPNTSFFDNINIDLSKVHVRPNTCVCLMPFNDMFNDMFFLIKNICERHNYRCYRSDDEYVPDDILRQTIKMLSSAQVVIAVLDGRNSNVFYEIGIAHSIGKMVIMLADQSDFDRDMSFDVRNKRFVLYRNQSDLDCKLGDILERIRLDNGM